MVFRFCSAIALVVLVSLLGTAFEKQSLSLRRELSRQHYQMELLLEQNARLRLEVQELGAPLRLIDALESGTLDVKAPEEPARKAPRSTPLLNWRQGGEPER